MEITNEGELSGCINKVELTYSRNFLFNFTMDIFCTIIAVVCIAIIVLNSKTLIVCPAPVIKTPGIILPESE